MTSHQEYKENSKRLTVTGAETCLVRFYHDRDKVFLSLVSIVG